MKLTLEHHAADGTTDQKVLANNMPLETYKIADGNTLTLTKEVCQRCRSAYVTLGPRSLRFGGNGTGVPGFNRTMPSGRQRMYFPMTAGVQPGRSGITFRMGRGGNLVGRPNVQEYNLNTTMLA